MAQDTEWHVSRQVKAGKLVFKALACWDRIDFMACNCFWTLSLYHLTSISLLFPLNGLFFPGLRLSTCSLFKQVEVERGQQRREKECCSEEFSNSSGVSLSIALTKYGRRQIQRRKDLLMVPEVSSHGHLALLFLAS